MNETPFGMTMNDDGSILNWLGENYVRQENPEVTELRAALDNLRGDHNVVLGDCDRLVIERDNARDRIVLLERLLEAKEAHLEREARVANHFHETIEKERHQGDAMAATFNHLNDLLKDD